MKFNQLELISSYYDGETFSKPFEDASGDHDSYKTLLSNFELISKVLKFSFSQEILNNQIEEDLWKNVSGKIDNEDKILNKTLKGAFALPSELENFDLWSSIQNKLQDKLQEQKENISINLSSESTNKLQVETLNQSAPNTIKVYLEEKQDVKDLTPNIKTNNIQELLKASYQLPKKYQEQDLWTTLEATLDQAFHEEMFSENSQDSWSVKEKYFVGLSEFLDGEVSAKKAQQINDHLLECAACRKTYLSFSKLKQLLKFSYQSTSEDIDSEYFWSQIEFKLFPSSNNFEEDGFRRVQGF